MSRTQGQKSASSIEDEEQDDLEEEVYRISEATNEDGTVDVEIKNAEKHGSKVTLTFQTPWLEEKEETMNWPKCDDTSYKIVRVCEETVGSFKGITQIEGAEIKADPETWEIKTEQEEPIDVSKYKTKVLHSIPKLTGIASVLGIVSILFLALSYPFGVSVLGLGQGASVLVASIILFIISIAGFDIIED